MVSVPIAVIVVVLAAVAAAILLLLRRLRQTKRHCAEQIAQQAQLLDGERQHRQADAMLVALSNDCHSVLSVDLDGDAARCHRADEGADAGIRAGESLPYKKWIADYADRFVAEADRPAFLRFTEPEAIRAGLARTPVVTHRYLACRGETERLEQVRFARLEPAENGRREVGMALSDVDQEDRADLDQRTALSSALTQAEKARKSNGAFFSRMSHEIRTPMNAIIGLDTLALNDDSISERTRNYLVKIGESAQHLLGLINEILDMSRIESGRMTLHMAEFAFKSMIDQVNAATTAKCADKGLNYQCHILSPLDDYYCGDETRLKEVLTSILDNAVKYTDAPGSVTMSVSRTAVFDDKTTLLFSIRDTGVGIDEAQLPRIFDAFSQEDDSRNAYGSTGLGLAIAKSLVDLMDGIISVESEKGVGTEFSVTVTLKNAAQKAAEQEELIDLHDMYVLVVDDNLNSAKYTKTVLDKVGITADYCTSGADALRMIEMQHDRHKPYHLVLMDCNMPEMNGLEATERIKAKYGNEITVVILTAYNWDYIAEEAEQVGVDSFLVKPLFPANVIDEFERIVHHNHITMAREKGKAELAGRRILLAEDMEINAEILMDLLSIEHIEADHAENGRVAVEMFKNSPVGKYSAILMDVRMPEMNGLEATEAIRALDREDAKKIPIIALTANAFDEDIKYSLQAGMNAHLCKPVESEQLFQVMGELILASDESAGASQPG